MKFYKRFILIGIIMILLTPVLGLTKEDKGDMELLAGILEKTDASFLESDISVGGVLLDSFLDKEELLEVGDSIRQHMEIKGKLLEREIIFNNQLENSYYWQEFIEEDGLNQLIIQGIDEEGNLVTISLSSYENEEDKLEETSLFINLINNKQIVENNDIILKIGEIFDKNRKPINVTSCIVGSIDGNIDIDRNEDEIIKSTKEIDGKVIEKYKEDNILSLSIFTPLIEEYIYTGNRKMNLNIAIRYNECEDRTYIWIGTPIITAGY